jgi:hypothetical protein
MLEVLQDEVFWPPLIGVPIASLLPPSRDVAEVLRKSHGVSGLVGAVVGTWSHLAFEVCPRNRIKPTGRCFTGRMICGWALRHAPRRRIS